MEWLAFIVSIAIIVCGYLIMKYRMLEQAMLKLLEEFLNSHKYYFGYMNDRLKSDLELILSDTYRQLNDSFEKTSYQALEIKELLIEIRKISDTHLKDKKENQRLKSILDRQERKKYEKEK